MAKQSASPSREILEAALQGLESQRQKLDEQISEVRSLMGGRAGRPAKKTAAAKQGSGAAAPARRKKRVLSAEARKRIAAAQKKRWANFRRNQE